MKNIFTLLFVSLLFINCSSDDNEVAQLSAVSEAELVGTWQLLEITNDYDCEQTDTFTESGKINIEVIWGDDCNSLLEVQHDYSVSGNELTKTHTGITEEGDEPNVTKYYIDELTETHLTITGFYFYEPANREGDEDYIYTPSEEDRVSVRYERVVD